MPQGHQGYGSGCHRSQQCRQNLCHAYLIRHSLVLESAYLFVSLQKSSLNNKARQMTGFPSCICSDTIIGPIRGALKRRRTIPLSGGTTVPIYIPNIGTRQRITPNFAENFITPEIKFCVVALLALREAASRLLCPLERTSFLRKEPFVLVLPGAS